MAPYVKVLHLACENLTFRWSSINCVFINMSVKIAKMRNLKIDSIICCLELLTKWLIWMYPGLKAEDGQSICKNIREVKGLLLEWRLYTPTEARKQLGCLICHLSDWSLQSWPWTSVFPVKCTSTKAVRGQVNSYNDWVLIQSLQPLVGQLFSIRYIDNKNCCIKTNRLWIKAETGLKVL